MRMGDDTPTLNLMLNGCGGSIAKSGTKILLLAILSLLYMLLQIQSYLVQLPEGKGISLLNRTLKSSCHTGDFLLGEALN